MNVKVNVMDNKLKALRLRYNLTLEELSTLTDISESALWKIENKKTTPSIKTMMKIADIYSMKVEEIFNINNDF